MKTRSTCDIWKQCEHKSFLRFTIIILLMFLLASAIWALSDLTWTESLTLLHASAMSLFVILWFTRSRLQKKMRGIVLMDAGRFSRVGVYTVLATLLLCGATIQITTMSVWRGGSLHSFYFAYINLLLSLLMVIQTSGSAEFCQNGIWAYTGLIPWSSIEAYEWKPSDEWKHSALWISYKNRLESSETMKLDVPENEKENVEALLKQHAPSTIALHKQLLKPIDAGSALQGR